MERTQKQARKQAARAMAVIYKSIGPTPREMMLSHFARAKTAREYYRYNPAARGYYSMQFLAEIKHIRFQRELTARFALLNMPKHQPLP